MSMEAISMSGRNTTELHRMCKKWKDPRTAERSPEHTKVWTEPLPSSNKPPRRVPVVYYLSRNGNLDHPHFIEVPLSSSDGLYLRDVIDRLNSLRGKRMAASYSWSSKRSYKSGFVWHDLAENDYIYPAHGQEYVLKGSELVIAGGARARVSLLSPDIENSGNDDIPVTRHRRNQSLSAINLHDYKVCTGGSTAGDAGTRTDEKRRRQRAMIREEVEEGIKEEANEFHENESSELSREEISPPPSDSSPENPESLMKADGKLILRPENEDCKPKIDPTEGNKVNKASSVLMQLISCGSMSLISHYKSRILPRGAVEKSNTEDGENAVVLKKNGRLKKHVVKEDTGYFSGSLIETKKDKFSVFKRSKSYTVDR